MRIVLLLAIGFQLVFANLLTVKEGAVEIEVQTQKFFLEKGEKMRVEKGKTICYISGKGRVVIDDTRQLSSKSDSCFTVPVEKGFDIAMYVSALGSGINTLFFDATETTRNGVGAKGLSSNAKIKKIRLKKEKELIVYGDSYGPLPVSIKVYDKNREEIKSYVNTEQSITLIRIPRSLLSVGHSVKVRNGFGQTLSYIMITE